MPTSDPDGLIIGVELGGTKSIVALSERGGSLLARERVPTSDPVTTLAAIRAAAANLLDGRTVSALGIGSFGPIDLRAGSAAFGRIGATPKAGWEDTNVLRALTDDLEVPTGIDTDVNAALLAEASWGAARNTDHVAYLTVGTGVGGAILSGGRLIRGSNHPELGHIRVPRRPGDTHTSSCPFHDDCLEGMASGTAIASRWGRAAEELGSATDEAAQIQAWYLAHGIAVLCSVVPVDLVIIGGGVSNLPGLHKEITNLLSAASGLYPPIPFSEGGPRVVKPELGQDAGVLGAIELGRAAIQQ